MKYDDDSTTVGYGISEMEKWEQVALFHKTESVTYKKRDQITGSYSAQHTTGYTCMVNHVVVI